MHRLITSALALLLVAGSVTAQQNSGSIPPLKGATSAGLPYISSITMTAEGKPHLVIDGDLPINATIEATESLADPEWKPIVNLFSPTEGLSKTYTDIFAHSSQRFYRLEEGNVPNLSINYQYIAIDVSGGTETAIYPVTTYATPAEIPGEINSNLYKTDIILLRRIPAGTYIMGSPADPPEYGRFAVEKQHPVELTKDFYIGVFEITQRQWELVMGNRPSHFENSTYYTNRPVETVRFRDIREGPGGVAITPTWPVSNAVHADSFMGKLRSKTGLVGFDLPTEAQWEYACRAGTTTALNSGMNLISLTEDENLDQVGRYWLNGGAGSNKNSDTSLGTAEVGSYLPNAWGLYDMHGNVREWCLDWNAAYPDGLAIDPLGPESPLVNRVYRGGGWYSQPRNCRSAAREYDGPNARAGSIGFRLALHLQ